MKKIIIAVLIALASILPAQSSLSGEPDARALLECRSLTNPLERLDCYDRAMNDAPQEVSSPKDQGGKWKMSVKKSPMDDTKYVTLGLSAENEIVGWPDKRQVPVWIIRANCAQNSAEMYVITGMPPHVENAMDRYTATVRFGADKPLVIDNMGKSTDGEALFFSSIATPSYVKLIERCEKVLFQFTPFNSKPVIAEFDVRGLTERLQEYRALCKE